ncbi:6-phosphogluconolactonase [Patescibacteria group bacterium]|nr:6-phosphogluconolactonase [Patescibacteria group bacterium]
MEVIRTDDKEIAAQRAAKALSETLQRHERDRVLLLLAGGSWLRVLDQLGSESLGENVIIGVTDERFSQDPAVNNFAQLSQTEFYRRAKEKGVHYINTQVQGGETIEELAARFEKELRGWKEKNPRGRVIVTQGIGLDGHTCGIMPYPEDKELFSHLFEDPKKWVVGYDAKEKNEYPLRVTITLSFLKGIVNHSIVYAVGENKKEALERVLAEEGQIAATPARIIHEMENVQLFSDIAM